MKDTKEKKVKGDAELISTQGINSLLVEIQERLFSIQNRLGNPAKKRVCKYLTSRHEGLLDWMKEE